MGPVATNWSIHMDTYIRDFYCDIDLNDEIIFDVVADALQLISLRLLRTAVT